MGGGNTAASSTVASGATPGTTAPRHVHLPDIPLDNNVLFELLVFVYSSMVLGLQYVNLYKTVWWLPHSSAHYGLVCCVSCSLFFFKFQVLYSHLCFISNGTSALLDIVMDL